MKPYVDILGTRYKIEVHKVSEDKYMEDNKLDGYCAMQSKLIVLADYRDFYKDWTDEEIDNYAKQVLRHEILHAFFDESGLADCANQLNGAWCKNEEMIDWFAIQSPKIYEVYKEVGCL